MQQRQSDAFQAVILGAVPPAIPEHDGNGAPEPSTTASDHQAALRAGNATAAAKRLRDIALRRALQPRRWSAPVVQGAGQRREKSPQATSPVGPRGQQVPSIGSGVSLAAAPPREGNPAAEALSRVSCGWKPQQTASLLGLVVAALEAGLCACRPAYGQISAHFVTGARLLHAASCPDWLSSADPSCLVSTGPAELLLLRLRQPPASNAGAAAAAAASAAACDRDAADGVGYAGWHVVRLCDGGEDGASGGVATGPGGPRLESFERFAARLLGLPLEAEAGSAAGPDVAAALAARGAALQVARQLRVVDLEWYCRQPSPLPPLSPLWRTLAQWALCPQPPQTPRELPQRAPAAPAATGAHSQRAPRARGASAARAGARGAQSLSAPHRGDHRAWEARVHAAPAAPDAVAAGARCEALEQLRALDPDGARALEPQLRARTRDLTGPNAPALWRIFVGRQAHIALAFCPPGGRYGDGRPGHPTKVRLMLAPEDKQAAAEQRVRGGPAAAAVPRRVVEMEPWSWYATVSGETGAAHHWPRRIDVALLPDQHGLMAAGAKVREQEGLLWMRYRAWLAAVHFPMSGSRGTGRAGPGGRGRAAAHVADEGGSGDSGDDSGATRRVRRRLSVPEAASEGDLDGDSEGDEEDAEQEDVRGGTLSGEASPAGAVAGPAVAAVEQLRRLDPAAAELVSWELRRWGAQLSGHKAPVLLRMRPRASSTSIPLVNTAGPDAEPAAPAAAAAASAAAACGPVRYAVGFAPLCGAHRGAAGEPGEVLLLVVEHPPQPPQSGHQQRQQQEQQPGEGGDGEDADMDVDGGGRNAGMGRGGGGGGARQCELLTPQEWLQRLAGAETGSGSQGPDAAPSGPPDWRAALEVAQRPRRPQDVTDAVADADSLVWTAFEGWHSALGPEEAEPAVERCEPMDTDPTPPGAPAQSLEEAPSVRQAPPPLALAQVQAPEALLPLPPMPPPPERLLGLQPRGEQVLPPLPAPSTQQLLEQNDDGAKHMHAANGGVDAHMGGAGDGGGRGPCVPSAAPGFTAGPPVSRPGPDALHTSRDAVSGAPRPLAAPLPRALGAPAGDEPAALAQLRQLDPEAAALTARSLRRRQVELTGPNAPTLWSCGTEPVHFGLAFCPLGSTYLDILPNRLGGTPVRILYAPPALDVEDGDASGSDTGSSGSSSGSDGSDDNGDGDGAQRVAGHPGGSRPKRRRRRCVELLPRAWFLEAGGKAARSQRWQHEVEVALLPGEEHPRSEEVEEWEGLLWVYYKHWRGSPLALGGDSEPAGGGEQRGLERARSGGYAADGSGVAAGSLRRMSGQQGGAAAGPAGAADAVSQLRCLDPAAAELVLELLGICEKPATGVHAPRLWCVRLPDRVCYGVAFCPRGSAFNRAGRRSLVRVVFADAAAAGPLKRENAGDGDDGDDGDSDDDADDGGGSSGEESDGGQGGGGDGGEGSRVARSGVGPGNGGVKAEPSCVGSAGAGSLEANSAAAPGEVKELHADVATPRNWFKRVAGPLAAAGKWHGRVEVALLPWEGGGAGGRGEPAPKHTVVDRMRWARYAEWRASLPTYRRGRPKASEAREGPADGAREQEAAEAAAPRRLAARPPWAGTGAAPPVASLAQAGWVPGLVHVAPPQWPAPGGGAWEARLAAENGAGAAGDSRPSCAPGATVSPLRAVEALRLLDPEAARLVEPALRSRTRQLTGPNAPTLWRFRQAGADGRPASACHAVAFCPDSATYGDPVPNRRGGTPARLLFVPPAGMPAPNPAAAGGGDASAQQVANAEATARPATERVLKEMAPRNWFEQHAGQSTLQRWQQKVEVAIPGPPPPSRRQKHGDSLLGLYWVRYTDWRAMMEAGPETADTPGAASPGASPPGQQPSPAVVKAASRRSLTKPSSVSGGSGGGAGSTGGGQGAGAAGPSRKRPPAPSLHVEGVLRSLPAGIAAELLELARKGLKDMGLAAISSIAAGNIETATVLLRARCSRTSNDYRYGIAFCPPGARHGDGGPGRETGVRILYIPPGAAAAAEAARHDAPGATGGEVVGELQSQPQGQPGAQQEGAAPRDAADTAAIASVMGMAEVLTPTIFLQRASGGAHGTYPWRSWVQVLVSAVENQDSSDDAPGGPKGPAPGWISYGEWSAQFKGPVSPRG